MTIQQISQKEILEAFKSVFPNSLCGVGTGSFMKNTIYVSCHLGKDKTEFAHGYHENDPLQYQFRIDENNKYEELACCIQGLPPKEKFYASYTHRIRKQTIKNITVEKLIKRFKLVKAELIAHKAELNCELFDIETKLI